MSKRLGILGAAIAAAALVGGVVSPAAGSSGNDHRRQTLRVDAIVTELAQVDGGTPGPSLGDQIVFSEQLLQGGAEVGHQGAVCTTVSLARQEAQCNATYVFGDGQITAQALIILGSKAPYDAPITGGSGAYAGAAGVVHVRGVSDTQGILTFDLQD